MLVWTLHPVIFINFFIWPELVYHLAFPFFSISSLSWCWFSIAYYGKHGCLLYQFGLIYDSFCYVKLVRMQVSYLGSQEVALIDETLWDEIWQGFFTWTNSVNYIPWYHLINSGHMFSWHFRHPRHQRGVFQNHLKDQIVIVLQLILGIAWSLVLMGFSLRWKKIV